MVTLPLRARSMSRALRLLVVDDEEVIRDVLGTLLAREGYDVTVAADAGEALSLFEAETVRRRSARPDAPRPARPRACCARSAAATRTRSS